MNNRLMDRSKQPQTLELRETVALTALIITHLYAVSSILTRGSGTVNTIFRQGCGQFLDLMSKDGRRKK